jgi:hypothetical protein
MRPDDDPAIYICLAAVLWAILIGLWVRDARRRRLPRVRVEAIASGSLGSAPSDLLSKECGPMDEHEECWWPGCACTCGHGDAA